MAEKKKWRGVHVQSCMKWLFETLLQEKELTKPPAAESPDPEMFGGGTPNMKGLFCVVWYVYEVGTRTIGRQRFLNWLRYEAKCHGHSECFSATHGQLWAGIFGAGLLHAVRTGDNEVRDLCLNWWRFEYAVYLVCETTSEEPGVPTEPWLPGGRAFKGGEKSGTPALGTYPTRGKIFQAIRGEKIAGKANQYDLGARCLAALPEAIREVITVWPIFTPPMWSAFHARRDAEGNFNAWFDGPRWKDATLAAGVFHGKRWTALSMAPLEAIGPSVLAIDAPASALRAIEEGRGADDEEGEEPPVQPPTPPQPPIPPGEPPVPPPVIPSPAPPTPPPTAGNTLEEELLADLRLLAAKYVGRAGLPPELATVAQMLISGAPIDVRTVVLTLLINRLGR